MEKNNKTSSRKSKKTVDKLQVRQMINSSRKKLPLKCVTTNVTGVLLTTGLVSLLNLPNTQGVAVNQRLGDQVLIDHLKIKFLMYYGDDVNVVRFVVMQLVGNQFPIALSDIFAPGASTSVDVTSLYNPFMENKLFHILVDKTVILSSSSSAAAKSHEFKLFPKIKTLPYVAGTNQLQAGPLYVLAMSDSGVAPSPSFDFTAQLYFRDI